MKRRLNTLVFAILVALTASSCGGGNATPPASSNRTQAAGLTLNSSSLDFGNVSVGSTKTISITLTNSSAAGGPSIVISQVGLSGSAFAMTAPVLPLSLAAGQSASISITFAPSAGGAATGTLSITIQSATQQISVPLSGNGLAPGQLGVSPSSMNFGTVTVGTSQAQTGTLTAGASDVNVSSASWNGLGFTLSGITFPVTVNAGSSRSFTVTFNPQAAGTSSGQVSFVSDATNSPTQVTLSGTGAQPVQHSVDLSWNPSTSQIIGYYIYRSNSSGSYGAPLNSTPQAGLSFTDSSVQSGSTYYYVVTAVDTNSQQSIHSNEAVAVIP